MRCWRGVPSSRWWTSSPIPTPPAPATPSATRMCSNCWTRALTSSRPSTSSMSKAAPKPCARSPASRSVKRCPIPRWTARTLSWWTCRPRNCAPGWRRARSICPNPPARRRRTSSVPATSRRLRELALRFAAEHVGQDVLAYRQAQGIADPWKSGQRLLVAVSASPTSAALVRWTRRLAGELQAPWLAVYVELPKPLTRRRADPPGPPPGPGPGTGRASRHHHRRRRRARPVARGAGTERHPTCGRQARRAGGRWTCCAAARCSTG